MAHSSRKLEIVPVLTQFILLVMEKAKYFVINDCSQH